MSGWIVAALLAAAAGLALWRWGRLPRAAAEAVIAALMLGLTGYVWQGRPGLADHPVVPGAAARPDEAMIEAREALSTKFGPEAQWLVAENGALRAGFTQAAVTYARSGLHKYPDSPDLWIGLAAALIAHSEGQVSPAAIYAFDRARALAPANPSADYLLGLHLAMSGQIGRARETWAALLARSPADAPWRADLAERIAAIDAAQAMDR